MNLQRAEIVRAAVALSVALTLTIFIGALLGFPANPAGSRANQERIMEFVAANPVTTPAENNALFTKLAAEPQPEPPPEAIAIIQWHWFLYAGLMVAALLAFRPGRVESAVVAAAAAVLMFAVAGDLPAIALAGASTAYLWVASLVPWLRRPSAPDRSNAAA